LIPAGDAQWRKEEKVMSENFDAEYDITMEEVLGDGRNLPPERLARIAKQRARVAKLRLAEEQKKTIATDIIAELETAGPEKLPDDYISIACHLFKDTPLPERMHEYGECMGDLRELWEPFDPEPNSCLDLCPVQESARLGLVYANTISCSRSDLTRNDDLPDFQYWLDLKNEIALHRQGKCSAPIPWWAKLERVTATN
jgi:hypothetical protein